MHVQYVWSYLVMKHIIPYYSCAVVLKYLLNHPHSVDVKTVIHLFLLILKSKLFSLLLHYRHHINSYPKYHAYKPPTRKEAHSEG